MKTVITLSELHQERKQLPEPVGLVPTMGYLHPGHLSLIRSARKDCASVVATIFINPMQFGPAEDLTTYPRDLSRDLKLLEEEGTDLVWIPTTEIMYPPAYQTWVTVDEVSKRLEGEMRPGHFRGVATVVSKLFNATQPQKAYFGQKDAQQVIVIRRMVEDLNYALQVVVCPTLREPDGLAMSSRNSYLNPIERKAASVLVHSLRAAQTAYEDGERSAENLRQFIWQILASEPLARPQYVSCAHPETLIELDGMVENGALLSLAVVIGKTRLIDNLLLSDQSLQLNYDEKEATQIER